MKRMLTIALLIIMTVVLYFVFSQVRKSPTSIKSTRTIEEHKAEVPVEKTPRKDTGTRNMPTSKPIDWANWALATLTTILIYGSKKSIDLYFRKRTIVLEKRLGK